MFQNDIKNLLALLTIVFFFAVAMIMFFIPIPAANIDLFKTFGIALITSAGIVIGYYFGSSDGSARKTELMNQLPPITVEPIPPAKSSDSGFISLRLLPLLILAALLMLTAGCATTSPTPISQPGAASSAPTDTPLILAGKSLMAVKSSIVTAATATDALCKAGKLSTDKCAQAKNAYELAKPAYDAAVDAYQLMSSKGGDAAAFGAALTRLQSLADNLIRLAGGVQ
jgi:hypothetical protein